MKKQKATTIYPSAIRGPLKTDPATIAGTPKKPLFRARDRDPSTIIAMGAAAAALVGLCIWVLTYWYFN